MIKSSLFRFKDILKGGSLTICLVLLFWSFLEFRNFKIKFWASSRIEVSLIEAARCSPNLLFFKYLSHVITCAFNLSIISLKLFENSSPDASRDESSFTSRKLNSKNFSVYPATSFSSRSFGSLMYQTVLAVISSFRKFTNSVIKPSASSISFTTSSAKLFLRFTK